MTTSANVPATDHAAAPGDQPRQARLFRRQVLMLCGGAALGRVSQGAAAAAEGLGKAKPLAAAPGLVAPGLATPGLATRGLAAPGLLRGTVHAARYPGVTPGKGHETAVQRATLAGLQSALDDAVSANRLFELEPATYEIHGPAGLVIPASEGLHWQGSRASRLVQFHPDAPIMVVGDLTGRSQVYSAKLSGFTLDYGVPQTGQVNANALVLGSMAWSVVEDFSICSVYGRLQPVNPPHIGLAIPAAGRGTFFNNAIRDAKVGGGQASIVSIAMQGTGNLFENVYMQNGANSDADLDGQGALTGPALSIANPKYATISDNVFLRCNIEAAKTEHHLILLQEAFNITFIGLHVEGVTLTSQDRSVVYFVGGQAAMTETCISDLRVLERGCSILGSSGAAENIAITGLNLIWNYPSAALADTVPLVSSGGGPDWNTIMRLSNVKVLDPAGTNAGSLVIDSRILAPLVGTGYGSSIGEYVGDGLVGRTQHYHPIIDNNYTHYGCHKDAVLMVPSSLPHDIFIRLHNRQAAAAGSGRSIATDSGTIVRIRRQAGSFTGKCTIIDQASEAILTINTSPGMDFLYQFDGRKWATL